MEGVLHELFQDYVAAHADKEPVDFQPLLEKYPQYRDSLEQKIRAYQKVIGVLHLEYKGEEESTLVGKTIAGCRIRKVIGQGGMGVVYLARQEKLKREIVIKVLRPFAVDNKELKERFKRESRIIGRLSHRNIVPVYDVGEEEGSFFNIMKYVVGVPLSQIIERISQFDRAKIRLSDIDAILKRTSAKDTGKNINAKTPTEFFCNLMIKVADAVQYAHDNGIIHRDIKPSNIIVEPDGNPVLLDFGLSHDEVEKNITVSGEFLGTPIYSPPESFEKHGPINNKQLDVYALGVSLYELLTGRFPYEGESIYEIYANIKNREPVRPKDRWHQIPGDLERIIEATISKDVRQRYQNVELFRDDLWNFLNYLPIKAKVPSKITRLIYLVRRKKKAILVASSLAILVTAVVIGGWYSYGVRQNLSKKTTEASIFETERAIRDASTALIHKHYDKAYKEFERLHLRYPKNVNIGVWYLAIKSVKGNDTENLLKELNELEMQEPDNFYVMVAKMVIYHNLKKIEQANEIKKKVISVIGNHPMLGKLPKYLFAFGVEDSLVVEFLDLALKKHSADAELHLLRGAYCEQYEKDHVCAQKHKEIAAKLNPGRFLAILSDYYVKREGTKTEIRSWIRTLKELNAESMELQKAGYWYSLSKLYSRINECKEAKTYIEKALNLEPLKPEYKDFGKNLVVYCGE